MKHCGHLENDKTLKIAGRYPGKEKGESFIICAKEKANTEIELCESCAARLKELDPSIHEIL